MKANPVRWILLFIVIIGLGALANSLVSRPAQKPETVTTVSAMHPLRTDLVQTIEVTGEMKPYQQVDVQSLVAGYVQSMNVDIGDHLKKGDLIATLEVLDIDRQMAAIKAAK